MGNYYLLNDGPNLYDNSFKYYVQGSSPTILKNFMNYLEKNKGLISEINASLYLYNNPILHKFLKELSSIGIKVNIFSIPLEGYDAQAPQEIISIDNQLPYFDSKKTKYDIAKEIYEDSKLFKNDNFNLYIFPHMYIRSERINPFSRGNMPYSLHIKSFYIKFKDCTGAVSLTSSNLAVRDQIKDELMIIVNDLIECNQSAQVFFEALKSNSIHIREFKESENLYDYRITKHEPLFSNFNFYTGPFFNDSQNYSEKVLSDLIKSANHRIYICAQHISAYDYWVNKEKREGILAELLKKSESEEENIEIKLLSQTFVDEHGDSHGCRRPQNIGAFTNFIKKFKPKENHAYGVNSNVHCKFIIVDDVAVITSCNFTPTQFIYLDNVTIDKFEKIPDLKYSGIHSEVGQYVILESEILCNKLIKIFEDIWNRDETYIYNKQTVTYKCPKCGSNMVLRNGPFGEFYGCSNFPQCKSTQKS